MDERIPRRRIKNANLFSLLTQRRERNKARRRLKQNVHAISIIV